MTTREEVQRELNELKAEVNKKQCELDGMKWRPHVPELRCDQWLVTAGCGVTMTTPHLQAFENGSVFETQKRAEHAAAKFRRFHLLYKLAEELNETVQGRPFECWSIQYLGDSKRLVAVRLTEACSGLLPQVYFKTKEVAKQAISIIENGGLE